MKAFNLSSFDWRVLYWCALQASEKVDGPAKAALTALADELKAERIKAQEWERIAMADDQPDGDVQ